MGAPDAQVEETVSGLVYVFEKNESGVGEKAFKFYHLIFCQTGMSLVTESRLLMISFSFA